MTAGPDNDMFIIGNFLIDVEKITVEGLKRMRPILPSEDYKILKKRKSARVNRLQAKEKKQDVEEVFVALYEENEALKNQLEEIR